MIILYDFDSMSTGLGLFHVHMLGNRVYFMFLYTILSNTNFKWVFLRLRKTFLLCLLSSEIDDGK